MSHIPVCKGTVEHLQHMLLANPLESNSLIFIYLIFIHPIDSETYLARNLAPTINLVFTKGCMDSILQAARILEKAHWEVSLK